MSQVLGALPQIITALSAAFAAYQYYVSRQDFHVGQALGYEQRFESDHLAAMQVELSNISATAINKSNAQISGTEFSSTSEREDTRRNLMAEYFMEQSERPAVDIPRSLNEITGFFDSLQICIEQKLCDRKTAHAFFDGYAQSLWKAIHPVIVFERSSQRPSFGRALERYIKEMPGQAP